MTASSIRAGAARPLERSGLGRRFAALALDWLAASAISAGFFDYQAMATLGVFFVMTAVLVATAGGTIGHRLAGIGVRSMTGGPPGFLAALIRTAALCLAIPAVVWGPDGRGLHDRWAGTQIVRLPR